MSIKKVILADDDADDRELFGQVLKARSGVILEGSFENGREVIAHLKSIRDKRDLPHLIILDHNMPKMNGFETLRVIKSDPSLTEIRVVIYSTYSDQQLVQKCTQHGAALVLSKPLSLKEYDDIIDRFLEILN